MTKAKDVTALLEVYQLMDSERHSLHEKAMFEMALSFGMELGRRQ